MIDARLFLKLQEVFADAFNHSKQVERIDRIAGPWGVEEYHTGIFDTVTLSEQILLTANAISHGGDDMERALDYLDAFKKKRLQENAIDQFYR